MERTTEAHVESAFKRLCAVTGHRVATSYNDVGAWRLDHNGSYGGFVVEEIIGTTGAVTRPLGDKRRSAREFYDAAWFAINAIESANAIMKGDN